MADDTLTVAQARTRLWDANDGDVVQFNDAIDALIAAVRAENAALTDADVDAYLADVAALPADPARVERIRRLFLDKLGK